MKIALRGGHNYFALGSKGIIDEVKEDRKVYVAVMKYLRKDGQSVLDVTPGDIDNNADLNYGVSKANNWGAELFVSIHFNKAYDRYKEALGTEAWINGKNNKSKEIAKRITRNLKELGFIDRGVKDGLARGLYEIKYTNMPAIIVEVCFVESEKDVEVYRRVGADRIGKAIAEGIVGHKIYGNISDDTSIRDRYGLVTASVLNVRSGPGTDYRVIGQLNKGTKVKIYKDKGNGWYDIYFGNHGGYVYKNYIELL
ncbi:N-acetylmuramoyl-L-alanine amidase [Clostridium botulinum]|uniref:N-acetylmuramoyl-L-alanine amidase n=1 Tax=Clostridium botulinum TaxID=1491 RepID=A0A9Q1UZC1_CLOBO|nr:N-acetylmuramoyl-L-alanine amidase [Clostridium botulinum]AEB76454.1 putative N-acetylmuramoyl-L-alanine amidase [Clostridium botulinum BKT015925]KEI04779.1 N-acetylmuramoyl-L-alanine amidase [Clostridium botulinum C/D str. Sp77]KLU75982.1 N-acetylmuramoyl-L-alanine amidase [Clostridium botulinum V891]KOA75470.1 N-acetylmuramoyl-L-alanine amidase [Clostridium botulinum]KOA79839.1 N-acetylmuramoyl-L-alanine amidase [Clostridium botulinum]